MKKLLIIVGLAFGCSSVYAQVTIQTGSGNTLTRINAGKTNPLTVSNVEQRDGFQTATITQGPDVNVPGQENVTNTFQRNAGATAPSMGNFFTIMQSGGSNRIDGRQLGKNNRASLTQEVGTANSTITTSQNGEKNGIVVKQTSGSFYTATIRQGAIFSNVAVGLATTNQNNAQLTQSGDMGTATVTQDGSLGLFKGIQNGGSLGQNTINTYQSNNAGGEVNQDGSNNRITTDQRGYQYFKADQGANSISGVITVNQGVGNLDDTRNTAKINQIKGNSNQATVNQNFTTAEQNTAIIEQSGTRSGIGQNSEVTISQSGKTSIADVKQDETGTFNRATLSQSLAQTGKGTVAQLLQGGENNVFNSDQRGNSQVISGTVGAFDRAEQNGQDGDVGVLQIGQKNQTAVKQNGATNVIRVDQRNDFASGIGNKATAIQAAPSANGNITINQNLVLGDENVARVEQTMGNLNQSTVTQFKKNTATVTQSGTDDAGNASNVNINQSTATSGKATVTQADGTQGGDVNITQNKIGNTATVDQNVGRQNQATVNQTDDNNTAKVTQTGTIDVSTGAASQVVITQNGKKGTATATQGADGSIITIQQGLGNQNTSTVDQLTGRVNDTRTRQFGDMSTTTVTQTGQQNVARTYQTNILDVANPSNGMANQTSTITQAGTINGISVGQAGLTNTSRVDQAGQENFAATAQYGTTNKATTTQTTTGRNNTANIAQLAIPGGVPAYFGARATRNADATDNAFAALTAGDISQVQNNNATIEQTGAGENQSATVLQTGDSETAMLKQPGSDNTVTLIQAGKNDRLTSTQNGTNGVITANQYGAPNATGNLATITDDGNNNETRLTQIKFSNTTTINQKGSDNSTAGLAIGTDFIQVGENNTATINQGGKGGFITGVQGVNVGALTIGGFTYASTGASAANDVLRNMAMVDQVGENNLAAFAQEGDDGIVTIDQMGNTNTAGITQTSAGAVRASKNVGKITQGASVEGSTARIDQTGRFNNGEAAQTGIGSNNTIILTQSKDNNKALLKQDQGSNNRIEVTQAPDNSGTLGGDVMITQTAGSNNDARVNETGYNNKLTLTQTGNANTLRNVGGAPGSFAQQSGHDNVATLIQTGDSQDIEIAQSGIGNNITATQSGVTVTGNLARFDQSGNMNKATTSQTADGDGNLILLTQANDKNTADIKQQTGSNNVVVLNQNPDNTGTIGGTATITQKGGSSNDARLTQTGYENELTLIQDGNRNILRVGTGAVGSPALQSGHNNKAMLSQTGDDHIINLTQGGMGNMTTVTQTTSML